MNRENPLLPNIFVPFADVIAFEGEGQFGKVLGGISGERHGQVEAKSDLPTAVIGELIELFIGFVASFALQNFKVFESGRADGTKAVGAKYRGSRFDESLSRQH